MYDPEKHSSYSEPRIIPRKPDGTLDYKAVKPNLKCDRCVVWEPTIRVVDRKAESVEFICGACKDTDDKLKTVFVEPKAKNTGWWFLPGVSIVSTAQRSGRSRRTGRMHMDLAFYLSFSACGSVRQSAARVAVPAQAGTAGGSSPLSSLFPRCAG